ncbi:oligosaccharide repeat unit polymerase, partial [Candidatus Pelagibacter sp.]|nr:oligosaccharide repeat unit polymerase [Candidatus Pelagibacter sp.]
MNTYFSKLKNILILDRSLGFYSLVFLFTFSVLLIFFIKKFDYVSLYCLVFSYINLLSISFCNKHNVKIGLFFAVVICGLYTLNVISFLFYYDNLPNLLDDFPSETRLKASHLFSRTLFEQLVILNPKIIHTIFLFLITSYLIIIIAISYLEKKLDLNFKNVIDNNDKKIEYNFYFKSLLITFFISFLFLLLFNIQIIHYNSLTAILSAILRIDNFIILAFSFFIFFKDEMKKNEKIILVILCAFLILYYIVFTLSKAIILLVALIFLSNSILLNKKIKISIVNLILLFLLFSITFFTATFIVNPDFTHVISIFKDGGIFEFVFTGLIGRLSYFEFYIEKIINTNFYIHVINFEYYFKVIIDKLTPGFDIYNLGFASRELYKSYYTLSDPNVMNSEQITIFAEAFILFKYFSMFYYVFIIFLLIYSLKYFSKKIKFINYLMMNYILY